MALSITTIFGCGVEAASAPTGAAMVKKSTPAATSNPEASVL
jgi:hypothetical protein